MTGAAKACRICHHGSRAAIEQAILNLKPKSQIARDFGFVYTRHSDGREMPDHKVIQRHMDRCMGNAYQAVKDETEQASGFAIAARLAYLDEQVTAAIEAARKGFPVMVGDIPLLDDEGRQVMRYDWRLVLAAVREGRQNADLSARLAGKLEQDPQDLGVIRGHLDTPEARALLARLERMAADQNSSGE